MLASNCRTSCRVLLVGLALATPLAAADGAHLLHGTVAFDEGGGNGDFANAITVQPDGKIVIAGTIDRSNQKVAALTRLLPNGALDPGFGGGGKVSNPCSLSFGSQASAVQVLANGKILLAGTVEAPNVDFLVWRLLANGSCDTSFGSSGTKVIAFDLGGNNWDIAHAMTVDRLGRIVLVGSVDMYGNDVDMGVVRLTPDGALDSSFSGDGKATIAFDLAGFDEDRADGVAIDRGGRILVAGYAWHSAGGDWDFAIAGMMDNGTLDSSFGGAGTGRVAVSFDLGGANHEFIRDVAVWPEGEIVAAGAIETGPTAVEWAVLRIAPNGSPVLGLHHGDFGFTGWAGASSLVLQPDGKILIAGYGQGVSNWDFGVARLHRDGSPDASFPFGTGVTTFDFNYGSGGHADSGQAVALERDGRILVAGSAEFNDPDFDFGWLRLDSSYIFADGFEWGDLRGWAP